MKGIKQMVNIIADEKAVELLTEARFVNIGFIKEEIEERMNLMKYFEYWNFSHMVRE